MPPDDELAALLLGLGRSVVLRLDAGLRLTGIHNPLLLDEWRQVEPASGTVPATLQAALHALMTPARARDLVMQVGAASPGTAGVYLGVAPLRAPRGGGTQRHVALSLHAAADGGLLLVLRDVSAISDLQQSLAETQLALDSAMAALRSPPQALRMFLGSALASISAIRITLRMPARDEDALRAKLARLHAAVAQLGSEAQALSLAPIQDACHALLHRLTTLLAREALTGDALLPLAVLVDQIAASAGTLWRIEEQRHLEAQPDRTRTRARRQPDWTFASARRWASFLRHRGEELGVIAALQMQGAAHVPKALRSGIDELLGHLLRSAVEHGIETPEERLAAGKPAAATISVKFESAGPAQLRMTVRDDGRGRGPGMTFARRAVARLGGQIAVAARPGQYTQFVIDVPHALRPDASSMQHAAP